VYAPGGQHRWDGQSWVALGQGASLATVEQKRANLQYRLNYLIGHGYRVVSQTDTNAQLVRAKTFSFLWASLWFLLCGVGVLFYVFYYANKKDEQIYLQVDDYGRVFP
jgi:hypothetical protein